MLTRNLAPAYHDLIVSWFRDQGFSVNTAYESDNLFNSLTLVACGIGVAFLPPALKGGLTRDVIFRQVQAKLPDIELFVAYRRDSQSEVLRSFLAVVRKTVAH